MDIIGMALNLGANKLGVENGYRVLKDMLDFHSVFSNKKITTCCIDCPSFKDVVSTDPFMKNKRGIQSLNTILADTVFASLKKGHFPLVIGGDHSLSWGSIAGVSRYNKQVGCVYIDAHGDFNLAEMSPSHNVHGMHMAYLMGLDDSSMVDWYQPGPKLNRNRVYFVGTRSLDAGEVQLAEKYSLSIQTSAEIRTKGIEYVTAQLLCQLKKSEIQELHISLDIDVIDPTLAPGTGVPEINGITVEDVQYLLRHLFASCKVISMDLVEFNPLLDNNNTTLEVCRRLLQTVNEIL